MKMNGHEPQGSLWIATPMLRLARNAKKGTVAIQQMFVDQSDGRQEWRELPMIDVVDAPKVIQA